MPKSKVTVIKKSFFPDLADKYLANPDIGPCKVFEEGQEWIFDEKNFYLLKEGFCTEAWDAISRYIYVQVCGGVVMKGWTNDDKIMIGCCNDGVRPVTFKIERIDDE
jgi:uncharacterized repeat protein (TIGR04076 family)